MNDSVTYLSGKFMLLNEMTSHLTVVKILNMAQNLKNKNKTKEQTLSNSEKTYYMVQVP